MIARHGLYLFHLICAPRVGPGSLRLARNERERERSRERGKKRRRLHPPTTPLKYLLARRSAWLCREKVYVYRARSSAGDETRPLRRQPPIFFDFIPFFPPGHQPPALDWRGTWTRIFLQVRFALVWVSTRGLRGTRLAFFCFLSLSRLSLSTTYSSLSRAFPSFVPFIGRHAVIHFLLGRWRDLRRN